MALVSSRDFDLNPNIGAGLAGGLETLGRFRQFGQENLALQREAGVREALSGTGQPVAQQPQVGQALSGQPQQPPEQPVEPAPILTLDEKMKLALQVDPAIANRTFKEMGIDKDSQRADMSRFAARVESLPFDQRRPAILQRSEELRSQGFQSKHTDMLLDMDESAQNKSLLGIQLMDLSTKERLTAKATATRQRQAVKKSFAPVTIVNAAGEKRLVSPTVDNLTGEGTLSPFAIPEGFHISKETDAEERAADILAVGQKESEKLRAQRKFKPEIEKAVITARTEATNRGEVFNELSQAKAGLPGLTVAVDELRELAAIATSTFGGNIFDAAVKETGFGSTKGATAKAKFIGIVNNQVLPLLKPTFGGAFSIEEGNALRATMGDIDASPEQKMAQLDAFIAQKVRDIEAKEAQLAPPTPSAAAQTQSAPAAPAQAGGQIKFLGFE